MLSFQAPGLLHCLAEAARDDEPLFITQNVPRGDLPVSNPRLRSLLVPIFYTFAGYQFVRYYVTFPFFYLNFPAYLDGHERLPFQFRIFPIFLLTPLVHSSVLRHFASKRFGPLHDPNRLAFFIFSLTALAIITFFMHRLYDLLTLSRRLRFLLFPTLLFTLLWTYVLHIEANFAFPYDLPSLAFFTAGLVYIYERRFLPLLVVTAIGSLNRETTLFLIGIYVIDAASDPAAAVGSSFRARFNPALVSWPRFALLLSIWLAIRLTLAHHYAANGRQEDINRIHENIIRIFTPYYWPAMLDICGYLIPFVVLLRRRLHPQRFANYLYILVPWLLIMTWTGVLVETRIYGELCCFAVVAIVLIFEDSISAPTCQPAPSPSP